MRWPALMTKCGIERATRLPGITDEAGSGLYAEVRHDRADGCGAGYAMDEDNRAEIVMGVREIRPRECFGQLGDGRTWIATQVGDASDF